MKMLSVFCVLGTGFMFICVQEMLAADF